MDVSLKVQNGAKSGQELAVRTSKFFVGRGEDCHLRPKSDLISRHHCVLLVEESTVVVRDLGSRNGTFVNGQRITAESELKSGDELKIGPLEFQVIMREAAGAKKRPKVTSIKEAAARTAEGGAEDEIDVSDWLNDEPSDQASTETQEIKASKTEEIDLTKSTGVTPDEPLPPPADAAKPANQSQPARPPRRAERQSADSKEAAENVLRTFFKRP